MSNVPQATALILLPDNQRGNPSITVNMRGEQVGPIRFYTHKAVEGKQVPDYTLVLSQDEHRRMMSGERYIPTHSFHSKTYEGN